MSTAGTSPEKSTITAAAAEAPGNKSASLTVINELPEVETGSASDNNKDGGGGRDSQEADASTDDEEELKLSARMEKTGYSIGVSHGPPLGPMMPPPAASRPTLLAPADMLRLQRKHERALRRANAKAVKRRSRRRYLDEKEGVDEEYEVKPGSRHHLRSHLPKASTCKNILVALYYTVTLLSAISAFLLLFVGLYYRVKAALIAGTLLAFTAFGLCTNHCVSQSLGVAKQGSPEEREAIEAERQILAAVAERSLSLATVATEGCDQRRRSTTPATANASDEAPARRDTEAGTSATSARVAMASAVDTLLARRLSTLGVYPDPAARMMMRQQQHHHQLHPRRGSSMMHLAARSMSLAVHHDPTWMAHPIAGIEDYTEFV